MTQMNEWGEKFRVNQVYEKSMPIQKKQWVWIPFRKLFEQNIRQTGLLCGEDASLQVKLVLTKCFTTNCAFPSIPYRPVTPAAHGWHLYVFLNLFYIAASLLTRRGGCTWRTPGSTSRHKSGSRSYSRTLEKETRAPIEAWECYYQVLFSEHYERTTDQPTDMRIESKTSLSHF